MADATGQYYGIQKASKDKTLGNQLVAGDWCRELTRNSQPMRKKKRKKKKKEKEKTHVKEKQLHVQDNIYMVRQCLCPRSCRDFTIIREKYKMRQYSFFFPLKNYNNKTLITKASVCVGPNLRSID